MVIYKIKLFQGHVSKSDKRGVIVRRMSYSIEINRNIPGVLLKIRKSRPFPVKPEVTANMSICQKTLREYNYIPNLIFLSLKIKKIYRGEPLS